MNYKDRVFPLDVILDESYWKQLQKARKADVSLAVDANTVYPFYSTSTGLQVNQLTWINQIDDESPYKSGYKDILWHVSKIY